MKPSLEAPRRWTGHRPLRLEHFFYLGVIATLSAEAQMVGVWQMQPFHHSDSSGNSPLWIYYAGFGMAVAGMFFAIGLFLKEQSLEITDVEIVLGERRCSRRATTLIVRPWRRLFAHGTVLEIQSGAGVWRVGAPHRATQFQDRQASAIAAWRVDVLMSTLDFDEVLARLGLPEAPPQIVGLRLNLFPFRRTAIGTLRTMKPFFLTILVLGVLGPTLGPVVSRMRYGDLITTVVVTFGIMFGIIRLIVSFGRPAKLMRLVIGADHTAVMDVRSGATLATAPSRDVGVEQFHFFLIGGRSEGMSFNNRALKLSFPSGFTLSIAMPALKGWPDRVARVRSPRWTLDLAQAGELMMAMGRGLTRRPDATS